MDREMIGSQSGPAIHYGWDKLLVLIGKDTKQNHPKGEKNEKTMDNANNPCSDCGYSSDWHKVS